jgi:hypothetical protein
MEGGGEEEGGDAAAGDEDWFCERHGCAIEVMGKCEEGGWRLRGYIWGAGWIATL